MILPRPSGKSGHSWENAMLPKFNVALRWAAAIVVVSLAVPAGAAEKLRVGKAVPFAWTFTPLDVGIQTHEEQSRIFTLIGLIKAANSEQPVAVGNVDLIGRAGI